MKGLIPAGGIRIHNSQREALAALLKLNDIEWGFRYQRNHQLSFLRAYGCPMDDLLGGDLLTVPLHAELGDDEQTRIIVVIRDFPGFD